MITYVAFLRAINVGGRNVKMEFLKKILVDAGYASVRTYIQSGNVVFESTVTEVARLEEAIASVLEDHLGYEVATFVYRPSQLAEIVAACPFQNVPEEMALHVSLLSAVPSEAQKESLLAYQTVNEQYQILGSVVYIMVLQGKYGETKFSNTFLEKKLKVKATTRNWATINRMATEY